MDHLTIAIPDGLDDAQKAQLEQWLTLQAAEAIPASLPAESDPTWQAETRAQILRGIDDIEAGRTRPAREVLDQLATKYGLSRPA